MTAEALKQRRLGVTIAVAALAVLLAVVGFRIWWGIRNDVALGPQRTVETINPKVGVHTRLTDEVEEWKIKRSLEMVREMGAPWIVEYFPWSYIEEQPGVYNWVHADQVVEHAERQGLTLIARLGYVPEWARPKETTPLYLDEDHFADFAAFCAAFTERYKGKVHSLVIWNEPNLALEWGYERPDPAKYVEMLREVYPAVKAVDPDVEVLAGALAPTTAPPGSEWGMNDLDFLEAMYDDGAGAWFDALAVHAYGWHSDPDEPPSPEAVNFRRTELLREIMVRRGDADKPVYITEGGWNDHPRWTRAVRPGQRIDYTLRAYDMAQNQWPWLKAVCIWAFRYPWDARNYQDYFTFVRTDFEPKPIYLEVQEYTEGKATPELSSAGD